MTLMTYEQIRQIKQLLLCEQEREEFAAASQQWNILVENPAIETLSNCFKSDGAPCASLHPALLSTSAFRFQGLSN